MGFLLAGGIAPPYIPGTLICNAALPEANTNLFAPVSVDIQEGKTGLLEIYFCASVSGHLSFVRNGVAELLNGGEMLPAGAGVLNRVPVNNEEAISLRYSATDGTVLKCVITDVSGIRVAANPMMV